MSSEDKRSNSEILKKWELNRKFIESKSVNIIHKYTSKIVNWDVFL